VFVVDTNVLVYAANRHSAGHKACQQLLSEWRRRTEPWYLTWGVIYEFLRVATHPRVFPKPLSLSTAWTFLNAALASPAAGVLQETRRHEEVFKEVAAEVPDIAGNLVFDAHTAVLMREHGIRRIYTQDAHFRRFPFLEVMDPLQ